MTLQIGQQIRQIRKEKKKTLKEVANHTGVSISFLSQLELDKTNATLETLRKISGALDVHPSTFFANVEQQDAYPFHYKDLSNDVIQAPFKPMKVLLKPSENLGDEITHIGYEFIYVLKGNVIVTIEGERKELSCGQSLMFDSSRKHYWKNETQEEVELLVITTT